MSEQNMGLLFNTQKRPAIETARRLIKWGKETGINFMLPPLEASAISVPEVPDNIWRSTVKYAVVLGGDGTFLRAARYTFGYDIPLYGINLGRLGFLATGDPSEAEKDIMTIISGNYKTQKRHLLKGVVWRGERPVYELHALNDLVISKSALARVIDIEVKVGKELLTVFLADGLILSTPTGSTAYALSTGGPIIPPHVPCMILSPICAHTLYARPVVLGVSDSAFISPKVDTRNIILTQDGQLGYELLPDDCIEVMLDPDIFTSIIQLSNRSYYDLLREKLRWGYNGIGTNYDGDKEL